MFKTYNHQRYLENTGSKPLMTWTFLFSVRFSNTLKHFRQKFQLFESLYLHGITSQSNMLAEYLVHNACERFGVPLLSISITPLSMFREF